MEVIVIRGKIDDGNHIYGPGEVISGLSSKDAESLVEDGYCSWHIDATDGNELVTETDPPSGGTDDEGDPPPPDGGEDDGTDNAGAEGDGDGGPNTSVTVAEEPKKRK